MNASPSAPPTIGDIGEFALIDLLAAEIGTNRHVLLGPGDDAAHVATNEGSFLVSSDLLVEGRHFRRDWSSANEIGRKAAASNLSDINAMGGVATTLTVGFAAPADLPVAWAVEMVRGFEHECSLVGAHIVGGDVTAADAIVIAVTAMGEAPRPVRRSGASVGDIVAVAGDLGLAAAGLATLSRGFRSPKVAVDAHRAPHPPYAAGPQAAQAGATSMTDISDGLIADVAHIAAASSVRIDLDISALVIPEAVATVAEALGRKALDFMLTGGDSYALAATFGPDTPLPQGWTRVGEVLEGAGVTVDGQEHDGPSGHQHFR